MSEKKAKQLRRDNHVTIRLDIETAQWLQGFFALLLSPLQIGDLTRDAINAREVLKSIEEAMHGGENTSPTTE